MNSKAKLDISIIVPNYNNGQYLSAFINSVMDSTVEPAELIIVDDGSKDHSLQVLDSFKNLPYLRVIKFNQNKGLTAALNAALEASRGKYIMRADPDDKLLPHRIESQFNYMETHPELDVLGCNVIYFDSESGAAINTSNFPKNHEQIVKAFKKGEHGLQHPTAFVKGEVYRKYRYQPVFPGEDYEIFARMVRDGNHFANLVEPHYLMRVHFGSATSNLKYAHIKTTFNFRDQIFGTHTSALKIWFYFYYMLYYRKSQSSHNSIKRYGYLFLSGICYPSKVFKRLF